MSVPVTTSKSTISPVQSGAMSLLSDYANAENVRHLCSILENKKRQKLQIFGTSGSFPSLLLAAVYSSIYKTHLVVFPEKEQAAYFYNDVRNLLPASSVLFLPHSQQELYDASKVDNADVLMRSEVLERLSRNENQSEIVVTYAQALAEKVVNKAAVEKNTLQVKQNERIDVEFLLEVFVEYGFDRVDFVSEPGEFSIRGGIIDVFSFSHEDPFRIELFGEEIETIRTFDLETQLSKAKIDHFYLVPNVIKQLAFERREPILQYLVEDSVIWMTEGDWVKQAIQINLELAEENYHSFAAKNVGKIIASPEMQFMNANEFEELIQSWTVVELGQRTLLKAKEQLDFRTRPQTAMRRNFELLITQMKNNSKKGINNVLFAETRTQMERLQRIFTDLDAQVTFRPIYTSIHEGYIDEENKLSVFTDHQIFDRYHNYKLKNYKLKTKSLTLKELKDLRKGDFITHIDHGVGRFDGLEKLEAQGRHYEAVRIIYKDNDTLYVGINTLHKISKYSGPEGSAPKLNKLGSDAWEKLKTKTKSKLKDIATDLIKLYAKRKAQKGFAFSPDTYLQHELEASFIYEDTPDQAKSTEAVKADMEKETPMDRLVCGDVGFGKTEIAIRAAFKAVTDSKQVAVLVPTTILAFQHWKTFKNRLEDFPVNIDYINRFRSAKQVKEIYEKLESGKIDIVIGTHAILSKKIKFKDLGLLIIDEEQKFGVAAKERLKEMRTNVDNLTLTATPIPRTLQFSLLGARDFSIINTAPPNRQAVTTELCQFDEDKIRDAIRYEVARGGQVYFVHNRIKNIKDVAANIQRLCPEVRISIGHGQMDGDELEEVLLAFMDGSFDVLVSTNIIESGLDIPNANTIFINHAENFGLSDMHQMRGRVGRSNIKAYCYLITPQMHTLSSESVKRLKAIEELSDLGSGFNVAMRDMDIRGAGNLLGAEQSGFIAEIGFEMYHKILDEAISELKENDFKDLFEEEVKKIDKPFASDCQVDCEMDAFFPDSFIRSSNERVNLYLELDSIEKEEKLEEFMVMLNDRFGRVPKEVFNLFDVVRIRWIAKELGIERLLIKPELTRCYFVKGDNSRFYQSERFGKILKAIQDNPIGYQMKQKGASITLEIRGIKTIQDAMKALKNLKNLA